MRLTTTSNLLRTTTSNSTTGTVAGLANLIQTNVRQTIVWTALIMSCSILTQRGIHALTTTPSLFVQRTTTSAMLHTRGGGSGCINSQLSPAAFWVQSAWLPNHSTKSVVSPSSRIVTSALSMVQYRGLETRAESATPTEGGMTLYLKAGPDGKSVGDCPFAHFVRMVLEEKGLEYDLKPSTKETKPTWLVESYGGKMPALRHRKECYVESDVIAEYLEFFFPNPPLKPSNSADEEAAQTAVEGLFPAIAKYLKHAPDGDDEDLELKTNLEMALTKLEKHLKTVMAKSNSPVFLTGSSSMTVADCSLAPKLYHLQTGVESFKDNAIDLKTQFPSVAKYMETVFARPSFQNTVYPKDVVVWGWGNARA